MQSAQAQTHARTHIHGMRQPAAPALLTLQLGVMGAGRGLLTWGVGRELGVVGADG